MKKVLYVHCVTSHIVNFHLPYLKKFKMHNYLVHVATNGDEYIENCDQHYNVCFNQSPFSFSNVKALFQLRKIINDNDYEYIILNGAIGGMLGRIAAAISTCKSNLVYFVHGFPFYSGAPALYNLFYKNLEKFLLRFTDILIVTNRDDCDRFKEFKLKRNIKFYYMPGIGIDSENFLCNFLNANIFKEEFNIHIDKKDFIIITAGEFTKRKNHKLLFDAMKKIDDVNIKLLICGEGILEKEYHQYIKNHDIRNIFFLGYCKNLPQLIANSDLFVFPSKREGLPVVIQIAMLNGTTVLASNIRGHNDLIVDNENGLLFDGVDDLVEKIKYLRDNSHMMEVYSQNSLKKVKNFDISKTMLIFEKIFFGEDES